MGFYIRKSIRLGPVRFNLSKSGIGTSIGVKGFRIGSGPRGNYIHAGRGGFYYRASLPSRKTADVSSSLPRPISESPRVPEGTVDPLKEIESGDVLQLVEASSASLLEELNNKRKRIRFWPFVAALTVGIAVLGKGDFMPWLVAAGAIITIGIYYYDGVRKSVVLFYDFEPEREAVFKALHDGFELMMACKGSWHTDAQGNVRDRKYHAGAGTVIKRSAIRFATGQPPFVKTNIDVPVIPTGKQMLYFFPDRLLVFQKNAVGAVGYNDLNIVISPSKFVEDGPVPSDAEIVGRTWRYVNKNGGPDRRFNNNRELPIALYEEVRLQSGSGLNEIISLSKRGNVEAFSSAITKLIS